MDFFTIELVPNESSQLFPNITLSAFTKFFPEQLNLDGQWDVAISEISLSLMYEIVTEGKFIFNDKVSKTNDAYYLEPGLFSPITDLMEDENTLIQGKNNHGDSCISWS